MNEITNESKPILRDPKVFLNFSQKAKYIWEVISHAFILIALCITLVMSGIYYITHFFITDPFVNLFNLTTGFYVFLQIIVYYIQSYNNIPERIQKRIKKNLSGKKIIKKRSLT